MDTTTIPRTDESEHGTGTTPRRKQTFRVGGMHCAGCSSAVEKKLNGLEGVEAAVSLASETATVTFPETLGFEGLRKVVEDAGYELEAPPETGEDRAVLERRRLERGREKLATARRRMWIAWGAHGPGHGLDDPGDALRGRVADPGSPSTWAWCSSPCRFSSGPVGIR